MIVFLDFDGVLHPFPFSEHDIFSQKNVFQTFFRQSEFLDISFVISSTWRNHHDLETLKKYFDDDFQARIIGVTPRHEITPDNDWIGSREREILDYLQQHQLSLHQWIALDDLDYFFDKHAQHVYFCDNCTGLVQKDFPKLAEHIRHFRSLK